MSLTADVVVIGAGVIGSAIALELQRQKKKTITIDANPEAGHGSTSGSCAIVRMHYSTLDGTALAWEGYHYWRDWEACIGGRDPRGMADFLETGCLVMQTEANRMLRNHVENSDKLDIPYEVLDNRQILERLPFYDLRSFSPARRLDDKEFGASNGGRVSGGVFWPKAGYVTDPKLSAQNLQWGADQLGAKFMFSSVAVDFLRSGDRICGVQLADGTTIECQAVINVAGPHSAMINQLAGVEDDLTIKTRALKQEVAHVPAPEGFDFEKHGIIVSDSDIGCYVRPEKGNYILIGSEDPECDPREYVNPDEYDRNFTDQWTTQVHRYAQRVPSLGIPSRMRGVVDLYDVTDDWIPIYDASSTKGYYMAIGTSGNQYKNAPVVGKLMAALVEYCEGGNNHDENPLQFNLPYIEKSVDIGFYSRHRRINENSSFSVLG